MLSEDAWHEAGDGKKALKKSRKLVAAMVDETLVDGWMLCMVLQNCDPSCATPEALRDHPRGEKLVSLDAYRNVLSKATKLDLNMKSLGKEGGKAIAPILEAMPSLQTLLLFANRLEAEGAAALAAALGSLQELKTLNLGTNFMGEKGAAALAETLGELSSLHTLLLGQNEIGPAGVAKLAAPLQRLRRLQKLELGSNELGLEGARTLVPVIGSLQDLKTLFLDDNEVGADGVSLLLPCLLALPSLESVYLDPEPAAADLSSLGEDIPDSVSQRGWMAVIRYVKEAALRHAREGAARKGGAEEEEEEEEGRGGCEEEEGGGEAGVGKAGGAGHEGEGEEGGGGEGGDELGSLPSEGPEAGGGRGGGEAVGLDVTEETRRLRQRFAHLQAQGGADGSGLDAAALDRIAKTLGFDTSSLDLGALASNPHLAALASSLGGAGGPEEIMARFGGGRRREGGGKGKGSVAESVVEGAKEVDWQQLEVGGAKLGEAGGRKTAMRAQWRRGGGGEEAMEVVVVSMKGTKDEAVLDSGMLRPFEGHPHITQVLGQTHDPEGGKSLILELAPLGSVSDVLQNADDAGEEVPQKMLAGVAAQVCSAMEALADAGVTHRGLAAHNVLVFSFDVAGGGAVGVKVTDWWWGGGFGGGRARWMAPESIRRRKYSEQSDVWAFGTTLWEVWSNGDIPFGVVGEDEEVARRVVAGERLPRPEGCDDAVWHVMQGCWAPGPLQRPRFAEVRPKLEKLLEDLR